ncbi:MAG: prephenate dehydratase domain-containing protein [Candidatus Neomarinimicrobiota bacterium]|nr:prephenate dehydratase domain-containing protein [Candidatus Neomarinimicrobiota bacterium]
MARIGIQGARGSFSENAAHEFASNHGLEGAEIEYLITSEAVLEAVINKTVDYGVFAMANAQGGVVIESVEALAKYRCDIVEMFHIPVDQNLLGLAGTHIGDITEIHSHQQALRQCKDYLGEHFWTRPLIEADDTAEAARRLSEGKLPKTAGVIANKECAAFYDLEVLHESIHDLKHNLTLFLAVKTLDRNE